MSRVFFYLLSDFWCSLCVWFSCSRFRTYVLVLPSRSKFDHPGVKFGEEFWCTVGDHTFIGQLLELFEIIAFVAESAVFVTVTTV